MFLGSAVLLGGCGEGPQLSLLLALSWVICTPSPLWLS